MLRKMIKIDEETCNGCGECIIDCPEGALQLIDGKARLVSEFSCDGLGACIGSCPVGAITVEEREAEVYNEEQVIKNIIPQGENVIAAHLQHLKNHGETENLATAVRVLKEQGIPVPESDDGSRHTHHQERGCPSARAIKIEAKSSPRHQPADEIPPELRQWPVQLKLINPSVPYFQDSDLLFTADCVPFAYAEFHRRLLKGHKVITLCPKLDPYLEEYDRKLTELFQENNIHSVTVAHMEVPCCAGIVFLAKATMAKAGKNIPIRDITITIDGNIK